MSISTPRVKPVTEGAVMPLEAGTRMTVCSHTGISLPECSCRACLQAQIERHMPSFLDATQADLPTVEVSAASGLARLRFARRLSRLRRVA
jgi:hypothetical protein